MPTGYPTDLTDDQWALVEPFLPPSIPAGARRTADFRSVVNSLLSLVKAGCQWRMLPRDLGTPWPTVYGYFAAWQRDGTWGRMHRALARRVRAALPARDPTPSAGCIDGQTAKGTDHTESRGYDGGKRLKGRRRHILTDTLGLVLVVVVTPANVDDGAAASAGLGRLDPAAYPRFETVFADQKYHNHGFNDWLAEHRPGWRIEIQSKAPGEKGFRPLKERWVVERTFAWMQKSRRLSKDYERTTGSSEGMTWVSHLHLLLRRLGSGPMPTAA